MHLNEHELNELVGLIVGKMKKRKDKETAMAYVIANSLVQTFDKTSTVLGVLELVKLVLLMQGKINASTYIA